MKKYIALALFVSFFINPAIAAPRDKTNDWARSLIKKGQSWRQSQFHAQSEIVKFLPSPLVAEQGADYSVFITPTVSYADANILLDASLNNSSNTVPLIRTADNLWIFHSPGFSELKTHTLSIFLSLENKKLAKQYRDAIDTLTNEIFKLQKKIDAETDPAKRAVLIAQRDEKIVIKEELVRQLAALKTPIASQSFTFTVSPAINNPLFPRALSVSPQAGSVNGGTPLTIHGENFVDGVSVKIGGIPALTAFFVDANTIAATVPSFNGQTGIKDFELRFPPLPDSTEERNTILKNAFFATDASLDHNVKPVAVVGSHITKQLGESAEIDGSGSYDPNGPETTLSYSWRVVAAPEGASPGVGDVLDPVAKPVITPTAVGYFVFELKVQEQNTPEQFVSEPALATLEIVAPPPVNNPPQPTAPAIAVDQGATATSQVAHGDPDPQDTFTYSISVAPQHGTASIDANGLVTFTAAVDFAGEDSLTVEVVDQGGLSGTTVVPITINSTNDAPTASAPDIAVVEGQSATSQITVSDPDAGQTHSFQVLTAPTKGVASVDENGLISYTANAETSGADSLTVRITDSGVPALFFDLVVNVVIEAAQNQPPSTGTPFFWINTKGSPHGCPVRSSA